MQTVREGVKIPQVCPEGTQPGKAREGISSPSRKPGHHCRTKQGRTVDTTTSQLPLQRRQALQVETPRDSGLQVYHVGRVSAVPSPGVNGKSMLGLSAKGLLASCILSPEQLVYSGRPQGSVNHYHLAGPRKAVLTCLGAPRHPISPTVPRCKPTVPAS